MRTATSHGADIKSAPRIPAETIVTLRCGHSERVARAQYIMHFISGEQMIRRHAKPMNADQYTLLRKTFGQQIPNFCQDPRSK